MDLRDFSYVQAIAKYQNITKAAEALYITQPTLSKFLISLEKELGQPLFNRIGYKYVPTYAGERFLESAGQILLINSKLNQELADIKTHNIGVLNVGIPQMRMSYILPVVLPEFRNMYPQVEVNSFEGSSAQLDSLLLSGEADVAFYSMPPSTSPHLDYQVLQREQLLICTPKNHPVKQFARPAEDSPYPSLNPIHLQDELFLSMMQGQRTRHLLDSFLKEQKLNFRKTMYFSNIRVILDLVAVGYGISFMFEPHIQHHHFNQPIDLYSIAPDPVELDFVAARRIGSFQPDYLKDFITLVGKI